MSELTDFFARRNLQVGTQIVPYVTRPSNPVTGALIPQHPGPLAAPVPPTVTGDFPGETTVSTSTSSSTPAVETVSIGEAIVGGLSGGFLSVGAGSILAQSNWTVWTPTVTPGSGAYTTINLVARYLQVGVTVIFWASVAITNAGTASGTMNLALPNNASPVNGIQLGVCVDSSVSTLFPAYIEPSGVWDFSTGWVTGHSVLFSGTYQTN